MRTDSSNENSWWNARITFFGLLAILIAASLEPQSGFTPEDIYRLKNVDDVQISPNGLALLYTEVDHSDKQSSTISVKLFHIKKGTSRVFRHSGKGGRHPRWSPDGLHVALIGKLNGKFGLIVTDAVGGKERFIAEVKGTNHPLPSLGERLSWAPDSKSIAFVSTTPGPETDEASGDPIIIRRYLYKPSAREGRTRFNDNRRSHIFLVLLESGEVRQLTDGVYYEHSVGFSPKGNEILFVSNREPEPDRFFNYDIFTVSISDGHIRRLTRTENAEYRPVWSPDGTRIAYQGTTRGLTSSETTMEDTHVWMINADGTNRREVGTVDNRQGAPAWSPDGQYLFFTVQEHGNRSLYRVGAQSGKPEVVLQERGLIRSFALGSDKNVVYVFHSPIDLAQVYWFDGTSSRRLTDSNQELLSQREIAETVVIDYLSFDGMPVQAYLTLPLRRGHGWRNPLIAMIKGGPHGQRGAEFNHKAQVYSSQGWAILQVNYRGSSGYGQAFADAIFGDQNGGEAKDVLFGVQAALRRYDFLDPKRLGVEGGSYGGQLTNWLVTQTRIFNAAIPIASISNLVSFNYMAYYHDYLAVEFGSYPHQNNLMDLLWERSPLRYVAQVSTPVMLVHGENDNDVPIAEAEQFYIALKDVGVEAVMVRYPREGHGVREAGHKVDLIKRSIDWYERHFEFAAR